jgi:hypothetical protein
MTQPAVPGWYPDPGGSRGQRYWDGRQWTYAQQQRPPIAHRPGFGKGVKTALAVGVGVVVLILVVIIISNEPRRAGTSPTTAAALTDAEQRFLAAMDNPQTQMLHRENASDVVAVGHAMCDALSAGATMNQAITQVRATYHLSYSEDVLTAATYAPEFLCPNAARGAHG